ncbi:hypothetical protein ABZ446_35845 [Streptomyces sp. NPDC005813]|uniref:hypothetical protein n=1 Tax=Streptomyces sp. NPDC005813 TaxID=3155592 RepID=UPI0033DCDD70
MNTTIMSRTGGGSGGGEPARRRGPRRRTLAIVGSVGALTAAAAIVVPGTLSRPSGSSDGQAAPAAPATAGATDARHDVRPQTLTVPPSVSTVRTNDGAYRITVRGKYFTRGATARIVIFKDGGLSGIPSWYKDVAINRVYGTINVNTGRLDCTAYGRTRNATLMVRDLRTGTWSNKVRVSVGCGSYG